MAQIDMPEGFFLTVAPLLPPLPPRTRHGGRKPKEHAAVLRVIWFALVTGTPWKKIPKALGCCGEVARTRILEWEAEDCWRAVHQKLLDLLNKHDLLRPEKAVVDSTLVRAHGGGDASGPSPVDRRKRGTKYTLVVDQAGVPLVVRAAPANRSDHREIIPAIAHLPTIRGQHGRPRQMPREVYADAGYDGEPARALLRWLGVEPHIRKRGSRHGSHLGKIRWVVERTISWFKGFRRMRVRYDRKAESVRAWARIAAIAICLRFAEQVLQSSS
jgi:transposase